MLNTKQTFLIVLAGLTVIGCGLDKNQANLLQDEQGSVDAIETSLTALDPGSANDSGERGLTVQTRKKIRNDPAFPACKEAVKKQYPSFFQVAPVDRKALKTAIKKDYQAGNLPHECDFIVAMFETRKDK